MKGNHMEAIDYFKMGYSCSESIIKEAIDLGLCDETLLPVATSFSGGIGSGCICGAVSGSEMIIGSLFGKNNRFGNPQIAREKAKEFIKHFKKKYPATCCRVLSGKFEFHSQERKQHCMEIVSYCSSILKEAIEYERV